MRLPQFLSDNNVEFEAIVHPPAFTAQKRARFLRLPGRHVVKAVLLMGPEDRVLAILPSTHHVDTELLSVAIGGPVRLATHEEVTETFRDCEWGVVPPFGTLYGLSCVIDSTFEPDDLLTFEGQSHFEAIRLRCRDFERLERPIRLDFARRIVGN